MLNAKNEISILYIICSLKCKHFPMIHYIVRPFVIYYSCGYGLLISHYVLESYMFFGFYTVVKNVIGLLNGKSSIVFYTLYIYCLLFKIIKCVEP